MAFAGFPRDTLYTPVPNPLLGPLLEQIQDLAELKVTLRSLWLLHRKRSSPRALALQELLADRTLTRGLSGPAKNAGEEIRRGLRLAVARGTLLAYRSSGDPPLAEVYLLNTEADRRALARLGPDGVPVVEDGAAAGSLPDMSGPVGDRPNIFALYEDNVGSISPLLAEQLKEAEQVYPWAWVSEAFAISATENKRNWRYIAGILRRWAAEGKDDGKPGRHSQKDDRQKYVEDYERRWGRPSR
ncbi:MAG: DnaD domain protein [candidate division NC10 bacterium]